MKNQILGTAFLSLLLVSCQDKKQQTIQKPQVASPLQGSGPCTGASCELPQKKAVSSNNKTAKKACESVSTQKGPKQLWAKSFIWAKAPKLIVEKWIGKAPDLTKNKIIILEFWNTWCPPCRRSLSKLTELQQKFKDDIIVIALTNESETDIVAMRKKHGVNLPQCYIASSPNKATRDEFGVRGVPHAVVIEPENNCVIWEGFPQQAGHELTESIVKEIIKISKQN